MLTPITINAEYIIKLVDNQIPESQTLEYKSLLPNSTTECKNEFLCDVISFANTSDALIIYGIDKKEDKLNPGTYLYELTGLPNCDTDAEILRLKAVLMDNTEPRLSNINFIPLKVKKQDIIVLSINKSFNAPHFVRFGNKYVCYGRNNNGKYQMDVQQIKETIMLSETMFEKIKAFRNDRIDRIKHNIDVPLIDNPAKFAIHILPFSSFTTRNNLIEINYNVVSTLRDIVVNNGRGRYNFEGYLQSSVVQYMQFFRFGGIEFVDSIPFLLKETKKLVFSIDLIGSLLGCMGKSLQLFKQQNLAPPYLLFLTLLNVKDYELSVDQPFHGEQVKIMENDLFLPEIEVDDNLFQSIFIQENTNYEVLINIFKTWFDIIWQTMGYEKCDLINDAGEIINKQHWSLIKRSL